MKILCAVIIGVLLMRKHGLAEMALALSLIHI